MGFFSRTHFSKGKGKKTDIALHGNPISELRDVTCRIRSHSVICHPTQVNAPRLSPAMYAGTRFTYPGGMEGRVDLVDLIAPGPGVEPATFRSRVQRRTAAPPRQPTNLHVKQVDGKYNCIRRFLTESKRNNLSLRSMARITSGLFKSLVYAWKHSLA